MRLSLHQQASWPLTVKAVMSPVSGKAQALQGFRACWPAFDQPKQTPEERQWWVFSRQRVFPVLCVAVRSIWQAVRHRPALRASN